MDADLRELKLPQRAERFKLKVATDVFERAWKMYWCCFLGKK